MLPQIEMKPEEFMIKESLRLHLGRSIQSALKVQLVKYVPTVSLACCRTTIFI